MQARYKLLLVQGFLHGRVTSDIEIGVELTLLTFKVFSARKAK